MQHWWYIVFLSLAIAGTCPWFPSARAEFVDPCKAKTRPCFQSYLDSGIIPEDALSDEFVDSFMMSPEACLVERDTGDCMMDILVNCSEEFRYSEVEGRLIYIGDIIKDMICESVTNAECAGFLECEPDAQGPENGVPLDYPTGGYRLWTIVGIAQQICIENNCLLSHCPAMSTFYARIHLDSIPVPHDDMESTMLAFQNFTCPLAHEMKERLLAASDKAADYLASLVGADGVLSETSVAPDLASQYKLPTLLFISGHTGAAQRLLDRIKLDFMQDDGDFLSYPDKTGRDRKSTSFTMAHFWTYMNNWIAMAAHRMGRFDVSVPAFEYSKRFYNPIQKAACVTEEYGAITDESTMGSLSTAHLGLLCLYMGDLTTAVDSGERLLTFIADQPSIKEELLLRMYAANGSLITTVPEGMAPFYKVIKDEPNQLYFFLGYHGLFMTKLYQATGDARFLDSAEDIMDFALGCHDSMYTFSYSHKLAYAAALVAVETGKQKYMELALKIAEYLMSIQTQDGLFGDFPMMDKLDQSAEIAIWLREINAELNRFSRK